MNANDYLIPSHLDDPPMFLLWDMDEAAALLLPFTVGLMAGAFFLGLGAAVVCVWVMSRIKNSGGSQLIKQGLYWYTTSEAWFKLAVTPPSDRREFVG